MPWALPAAIGGGALLGAVGSWLGANEGADAQRSAARMQSEAADRALGFQQRAYDQSRADLAPFRQFGMGALQDYYGKLQAGGQDADLRRAYTDQANNFNSQMAQRGLLGSSASINGLSDLGAKIAEAREQRYYERMQPLLSVGGTSAGQMASGAMNFGNQSANTLQGGAQAAGGLYAGAGQTAGMGTAGALGALGGGLSSAGALYGLYGGSGGGGGWGVNQGSGPDMAGIASQHQHIRAGGGW